MMSSLHVMEHIVKRAEEKIRHKASEVMIELYWELGFQLKEYSEIELRREKKALADALGVDPSLLESAYAYYKENPLRGKVMKR